MNEGILIFPDAEDFLKFMDQLQEHYNNKGSDKNGEIYSIDRTEL